MGKLIPILLAVLGIAGGAGAGFVLRPASGDHAAEEVPTEEHAAPTEGEGHEAAPSEEPADDHAAAGEEGGEHDPSEPEYVKLNNQFVVPVVENGSVSAMVILSLSLEVAPGTTEAVYAREPKLRDVFLQVLFDHANAGGFRGTFTDGANLVVLRKALLEVGRRTLGEIVTDVLIVDIARQDS